MIPFFQSNSLEDKYITDSAAIENFLDNAMQENKPFQLSIAGLENNSISRIVSIDRQDKCINFEDPAYGFDDVVEPPDGFSVTAEVRTDNKIMRFESVLVKEPGEKHKFIVHYPREIERNIKRQAPRFQVIENMEIPINLKIDGRWQEAALLSDISIKGIGFVVRDNCWQDIDKDLEANCMIKVGYESSLTGKIKIMHTFTVFNSGNKHAGAKFINLGQSKSKELIEFVEKMKELEVIT